MSKAAASAALRAAACRRNVARSDRSEINAAVSKTGTLTAAARREEKEPGEGRRRSEGSSAL